MEDPAFIISFLYKEFKTNGRVVIEEGKLEENLYFFKQAITQDSEETMGKNDVAAILNEWSNKGYLRRTAPFGKMEREYELTPSMEKIFNFIEDSNKKEFIGTESRLLKIFDILREISFHSTNNPELRIQELEKRKLEIEDEIQEIKEGKLKKFTNTQLKERYLDLYETSRRLLSDFREVENNFREIDSMIREQAIDSDSNRGLLLNKILEKENFLYESDQGRSFGAFLEFLISEEKKEELDLLIEQLLSLQEIQESKKDFSNINKEQFFRNLKYYMVIECQKVGRTNSKIAEGLKKFIVEKTYVENKRILEIIKEIKQLGIQTKELSQSKEPFIEIEDKPNLSLIMERPYFNPPEEVVLENVSIQEGEEVYSNADLSILYKRIYIDKKELKNQVKYFLKKQSQVSVGELLEEFPSQKGLLDVLGFFSLIDDGLAHTINENEYQRVKLMNKESGKQFQFKIPYLVFHNE